MYSTSKQQENKMQEPKEAVLQQNCVYSTQAVQLVANAEAIHMNPNVNVQVLH